MTPTQARDYMLPKFKAAMSAIGLEEPENYYLSDDGEVWGFNYLKCTDEQYQQAHALLSSLLNS